MFEYCPTTDMVADILTKPLPEPAFKKQRQEILNDHQREDAQESKTKGRVSWEIAFDLFRLSHVHYH